MSDYPQLKLSGPISAERVVGNSVKGGQRLILLLGATGVGKSSFLECVAGDKSLNISGDSLGSVTQEITPFIIRNLQYAGTATDDIYLIDSPGVSDNHLSELHLVNSLQAWMDTHGVPTIILYFHRITDKRLAGSQRRVLNLIKSLMGEPGRFSAWLGIVTTMWDTLLEHQIPSAENRLEELKHAHFKDVCGPDGNTVFKFHNTQASALQILNDVLLCWVESGFLRTFRDPPFVRYAGEGLRRAPFAQPLYELLQDRISNLEQRIQVLKDDLDLPETQENSELVDILSTDLSNAGRLLRELKQERAAYLALPEPPTEQPGGIQHRFTKYFRNVLSQN